MSNSHRGSDYEWPSDEELIQGIESWGGYTPFAQQCLGLPPSTLKRRLQKQGLWEEAKRLGKERRQALKEAAKPRVGEQVSREEVLQAELNELRASSSKERKEEVERERLMQAVEGSIAVVPPPARVGPLPRKKRIAHEEPHHRQLVAWSDWHGGEVVDPAAVNGLNSYNWEIMEERVEEIVQAMLSHKANSPALTGLDIALVGDMVSGAIHDELRETNQFPLSVQAVKMGHLLGQTIERLTYEYENIRVVSVVGNHPRLTKKPAAKNIHDNMDWLVAVIARDFLKAHPNVSFQIPTGQAYLHEVIPGKRMYVWHSDGVRSSMPGVPWGGIMRRVNEIRRGFQGTTIDYWLCGHWHQANVMYDLGLFMNGALKGTDEWVQKSFGSGSRPSQVLLTFSEKHSWLTDARFLTPTAGLPGAA